MISCFLKRTLVILSLCAVTACATYSKTLQLSEAGCDAGNANDCFELARRYHNGSDVQRNWLTARELYGKACLGASPTLYKEACERAASLSTKSSTDSAAPFEPDWEKAAQYADILCDAGDGNYCRYMAIAYMSGTGVKQSDTKMREYIVKACKGGYTPSCRK